MLQILFIGEHENGLMLQEAAANRGWHVHLPEASMEALGMYVFYMPNVVVIEDAGQPGAAADAYFHLSTLGDSTPILLTGQTPHPEVETLPNDPEAILSAIAARDRLHLPAAG